MTQQKQNTITTPPTSNSIGLSLKSKFLFTVRSIIFNLSCHPDGTVNRRLLNLADIHAPPSSTPINGVISSDHTLDPSRNLWFRLFLPANFPATTSLPLIIYFHGGGFVSFSPATVPFNTLCRKVAGDLAAAVISVNYRLSPEHRFPAPYDDGFDILKYLDDGCLLANVDLGRCFIAGDSAGGNVAHHLAVKASGTHFKAVRIRGLIAIQPFFGGEERMESELRLGNGPLLTLDKTDFYWKAFLPNGSNRDHPGSNVFGPGSESVSGLDLYPPTLLVVGGLDLLQDWQRRYGDGLRRSGKVVELVEYSNVGHGFYSTPELPEYDMLVAKVKEFVQNQLQLVS
ncbi:probable carboxylesterase 18 [Beta vulgaris subsp. vulgaris]|uniref:probable carboxylesterase 18 n=1 Tax=Beta vulgaris subsp. vulgaris TaxID=3555 RepID=UPI00203735F7|nr:probable carboxylesterase 18 [Beta vulgaris subsp. vulgaris]